MLQIPSMFPKSRHLSFGHILKKLFGHFWNIEIVNIITLNSQWKSYKTIHWYRQVFSCPITSLSITKTISLSQQENLKAHVRYSLQNNWNIRSFSSIVVLIFVQENSRETNAFLCYINTVTDRIGEFLRKQN